MFVQKIKSEGISHLSYILGDGAEAVVIDPRRDCAVYTEIAAREGAAITHIFETHRNEDYVIGSRDLARRTGATIHHGSALDFEFGQPASEGDLFHVGGISIEVLETPGHTDESLSFVIRDREFGDTPVGVFTGDALFIGDVGRTDFFPERAREVAGLLYDSIFEKLLPLGDQTILYPAHGAGSVCGDSMASREFSTLGYERLRNPVLQKTDREEFIDHKVNEKHYQPPYFRKMEEYNLKGAPPLKELPVPPPLSAHGVAKARDAGAVLVDLRSPEAFAGAFVPDSLAIPLDMLPGYAGYLLDYDTDLVFIAESDADIHVGVRYLLRMGYDRFSGYLKGGVHAWEVTGRPFDRIGAVHASTLQQRMDNNEDFTLVDVRKVTEVEEGRLPNSTHIFLGELQDRLDELDNSKPVVTFCGSGRRALIAAAILKRHGFKQVEDSLGSMAACEELGCRIERD